MKKNYGFYCSGKATRVLEFYKYYDLNKYPVSLVFYDGEVEEVAQSLTQLFGEKLVHFTNNANLNGKKLSQQISDLLLYHMQKKSVDYLFCFGNALLKQNLLDKYENKIINFHPSILPSFPGLNAIDQALKSSVQIFGNTAHFIDNGIDTGPIIMQTVLKRASFKCYEDVLRLQIPMLEKIWGFLESDKIKVDNQLVKIDTDGVLNNSFFSV